MNDFDQELAADGQETTTDLAEIRLLAEKQLELEGAVATIEGQLAEAKNNLRKVSDGDLPSAMKAAGITTFGLENGMTVSYSEDLKVSIPKKNKAAVVQHMKDWGFESLVTNTLTADLGKDNDNATKALVATAEEIGVEVTVVEDIATGTVKKALKARIDEGKNDELSVFGAYSVTKATVK